MSAGAAASSSTDSPVRFGPRWLAPAVIVLAVVAVYANTLRVPFLLDDRSAIVENPTITRLADLGTVLTPAKITTSGRPLLNLSFALNYAWGGLDVGGYHAVNLAIHALAALVLYGALRRTLALPVIPPRVAAAAEPLALAVGVLWAVHPLQTSAVTYLSQRAESLMGLFYLLTWYTFIRAATSARPGFWSGVSIACCLAGVLTKEVMMTAPVWILLFDRACFSPSFGAAWRRRGWYYGGLFLCVAVLGYLMVRTGLGERSVGFRAGDDWINYALTEFKVVCLYAKLALWPSPLVFDYGQEILVREPAAVAGYALAVALALAGVTLLFIRGWTKLGLTAAAFFILLSPTSSFIPIMGQPMAESRMYLPLVPGLVGAMLGLHRLLGRGAWAVAAAAAVVLGGASVARNREYGDVLRLWEDTVGKRPQNSRAQYNLATELLKNPARAAEAEAHYEAALRLKPDLAEAHINLANELARQPGRAAEALAHYAAAAESRPDLADAPANAARLLSQLPGRLPEAVAQWQRALALRPDDAERRFYLANALARLPGRTAEAIAEYEQVLRLKPDWVEAHNNLANELARDPARLDDAIVHLETALRLKPDYAEAHVNLANKLARRPGQLGAALAHYEAALRLRPDFLEAHYNYANKLALQPGRLPEAIAHYEAVVRLDPKFLEGRQHLALALANAGRLDEAERELRAALAINPGFAPALELLAQLRSR